MGQSVINGDGQYEVFVSNNQPTAYVVISDLKITAFFNIAINTQSTNLEVRRVEIDGAGSDSNGGALGGILSSSTGGETVSQILQDVYIHDLTDASATVIGAGGMADDNSTLNVVSKNTTVARLHNSQSGAEGYFLATGIFTNLSPGTVTVNIENLTIDTIVADSDAALGIAAISGVDGGGSSITGSVSNATIRHTSGGPNQAAIRASAIGLAAGGVQASDSSTVQLTLKNVVVDTTVNSNNVGCSAYILSTSLGGDGSSSAAATLTSQGGNLSSDTTCTPYFTQPTDQNNVGNLASTLGTLSNNGGYVPTIPLLQGSPAIDSGVTVAGLTTDARLATRPQGTAFDSGAYESPYSKTTASLAGTGENTGFYLFTALTILFLSSASLICKTKS